MIGASLTPALVLVAIGALLLAGHSGVLDDFIALVQNRGKRVGPHAPVNTLGVVPDDPEALADAAGLPLNTYALARMISSEEGTSPALIKIAVGWAAWNAHGDRIADVLTMGHGDAAGHFKDQSYQWTSAPGETSRAAVYASTRFDPYEDDVQIASAIVAGAIADPTGGATNFFRPGLQDKLYARGDVTRDADSVVADWTSSGLGEVSVPGVDPTEILFFRKGGSASG